MTEALDRFRVITGGCKPRRKKRAAELIECRVCETDIGVTTTETFEAKIGRRTRDGKPEGGTRALYCLHCLARGKITRLM